ncbi:sensor histidine kinase [Streptomyces sp. NPDC057302]|uniref:sensor histidine kinase n=1 Tax=Streptomyces sp. NPDC057302 TaxID=3346094 RepID=UPI003627FAD5
MRETLRRTERALEQLGVAALLSLASYLFIGVILLTLVTTLIVVGAGVMPETVLMLRRMAGFKRRRVALWTGKEVSEAYVPLTGTLTQRVRAGVTDPATYRDLRWLALHFLYGWLLLYVALPVFIVGMLVDGVWCGLLGRRAVVLPLVARIADLEALWSGALLKASPEAERAARLTERVEELTVTRAGAVAAHGAELRRIERDLHDGTQARLVSMSMRVGLARRAFDKDPEAARKLLADAQDQAEEALTELRHVVRGIHPPILTDRGLVGAVRALAASSGLDVAVRAEGVEGAEGREGREVREGRVGDVVRAPAAVEAAAYFVVAEALTNAAKHSGAGQASVELARVGGVLRISVRDEGRGGADAAGGGGGSRSGGGSGGGSGLLGMRRRVAALDGTVEVVSPVGGPTVIEVELPCAW